MIAVAAAVIVVLAIIGWAVIRFEQPRLDLGHRKGHGYEQSPFAHEVQQRRWEA
jgi:hypothetical protein